MPLVVDVTNESAVAAAVQHLLSAWERIDLLLNVAGIGVAAPFRSTTPDEYRRMADVNVLGVLYPIQAVLPTMTAQGEGHIVKYSAPPMPADRRRAGARRGEAPFRACDIASVPPPRRESAMCHRPAGHP